MRKLLPPEEVADLLNIPVDLLYHWRYQRTGPPAIRVGKYLRYDPSELERWLAERKTASAR